QTPNENSGGDEPVARRPIAQITENGRRNEVAEHERGDNPSGITVVDVQVRLQRGEHRGEDKAVQIIEQVQTGQDEQRPEGREFSIHCGGARVDRFIAPRHYRCPRVSVNPISLTPTATLPLRRMFFGGEICAVHSDWYAITECRALRDTQR